MLVAKIIICILTFIALIVMRISVEWLDNTKRNRSIGNIAIFIAGVLGITFCALLIITNWNVFTIPKILLFILACIYIVFKEEDELCMPFWGCILVPVVAYLIAAVMYMTNIKECETPDVSITDCPLICAKDSTSITGNMSGGGSVIIWHVQGSVSEKSVYKYYYPLDDGGIKQGTIPAEDTIIYFIKEEERPHIETTVTTTYDLNYNNKPATRWEGTERTKITYKLYVPEGSVTNEYEFDAN